MPHDGANFDTKPDLSVDGLIEWLEGQDPETAYCFAAPRDCLMTRFGRARGEKRVAAMSKGAARMRRDMYWDASSFCTIAGDPPHTYGAALARAKALRGS